MSTSPKGTIAVENIWKRYRADQVQPSLISQLGMVGKRLRGYRRDWRWVLKDINLHIEPGATVALTGVNGSGKSTLLRVISQVTYQTTGRVEVAGRIGALLELRSGIHPELTGGENIYLFGTILGLRRNEVKKRFDQIVEFSGLSDAIDRQVKFYSSGMGVRLGFSIAAFLDPDVLLVDEVLAVGDAHFQQQCMRRISEVVSNGATLIFVSHDLAAVEAMCERTVWLSDAAVRADGPTRDVLALYRESVETKAGEIGSFENDAMKILQVDASGPDGRQIQTDGGLQVRIVFDSRLSGYAAFVIGVTEGPAMPIFVIRRALPFPMGKFEVTLSIDHLPLPLGTYYLWAAVSIKREKGDLIWRPIGSFEVFGPTASKPPKGVMVLSPVYVEAEWSIA